MAASSLQTRGCCLTTLSVMCTERELHFSSCPAQVDSFKYVVHANGECAARQLRDMLSSDAAVMMISSGELEWYYPLLQPYRHALAPCCGRQQHHTGADVAAAARHYIPVEVSISPSTKQENVRLIEAIDWAEANPEKVAEIVRNARSFAEVHLSQLAQTCYLARLLTAYSSLLVKDTDSVNMSLHLGRVPPLGRTRSRSAAPFG